MAERCLPTMLCGINPSFEGLSPRRMQVAYPLRTRAPLSQSCIATQLIPFNLHVLCLPLAFILSQDQTLRCIEDLLMLFCSLAQG